MLKGLSHIGIWVSDLEATLAFYRRIPGVQEVFRLAHEDGSVRLVYLRVGDREFVELFPNAGGPHEQLNNSHITHYCLETDDIWDLHKALVDAGITPNGEPVLAIDGTWQFWIQDPDGNLIEFHEFTGNSMQLAEE